jgi:hypothetical protein
MPTRDYSLVLPAGRETTPNAGDYDRERRQPSYALSISSPYPDEIDTEQILIPTADGHLWAWRVTNRSSWPAFIIVTAEGQLLRLDDQV